MRIPRPPVQEATDNMLPLINIVFLLLIFFMLAGTLEKVDPYEIEPVKARGGPAADDLETDIVIEQHGGMAFRGRRVSIKELPDMVRAEMSGTTKPVVHVKADSRLSTPILVKTFEALKGAGVERVVLLTLERDQ